MDEFIKNIRHKKWELKTDLQNCVYYLAKRNKKKSSSS